MDAQRNTKELLSQIPQPGFLVTDNKITLVNQAAAALLLGPGQVFSPLLLTGRAEYESQWDGKLCLSLTIADQPHQAVLTRMEEGDLVLLESGEEQEEFRSLALAAMELRKPLMQAITSARQLDAENTAKMNQSLMQMLRLVGNMSDIGRYTASSRMEARDMDSFLLELFEKAKTLAKDKAVIDYEGLNYPLFIQIDAEQLERAVWNILSNSLRFLPEGGHIQARLTRQGKRLLLSIEDNGSGIPEHVRADLFRRYLRQPGIEDMRCGMGLGLAIVRTAASNHGGTVLISQGKDGGTRVAMTLAIRQERSACFRCPLLRPDYAGGFDHALVELADCLGPAFYAEI